MFYEVLGNESVAPAKKSGVNEILKDNESGENVIITSVITHLEVLPEKLEAKNTGAETEYMNLFDSEHFGDVELSANIILRAREIRDYYYRVPDEGGLNAKMMDLGDAIHLATATIHSVDELHTRDDDKKGMKVPLLSLYEMYKQSKVCDKYDLKIVSPESDQADLLDA